jgi:hypothetical protein
MEVVRGAVSAITSITTPDESEAEDTWKLPRPDAIQIHTRTAEKDSFTTITMETDLAVDYARGETGIDTFAERLSATREVHESTSSLDENSTLYYLKTAEWRILMDEQTSIINRLAIPGTDGEIINVEVSKVRPKQEKIYFEYTAPSDGQSIVREGAFTRSYWEAVRNVSRQNLVHRYPEKMQVYSYVPGDRDMKSTVRTKYAFDFIRATGGNITDENILINGKWNLYYGKVERKRYPNK